MRQPSSSKSSSTGRICLAVVVCLMPAVAVVAGDGVVLLVECIIFGIVKGVLNDG